MSLFFKGALWRHGPFLDLRTLHTKPATLTHLHACRAPHTQTSLRRTFAQATKPSSPRTQTTTRSPPTSKLYKSRDPRESQPTVQKPYLSPKTSYMRLLAARSSPTPLYQSPLSATYPFACVLTGGFAIAYGMYNLYDSFMIPHPGLSPFVPWLMAFVCAFMLGLGAFCFRNGMRLVGHVSAVPKSAAEGGLRVRVEFRSLVGRSRVVERPVDDVRVSADLGETIVEGLASKGDGEVARYPATEEGRRAAQVAKKKAEKQAFRDRLSNPFTHLAGSIGWLFRRLSRGLRRVVGREGFAELYIRRKEGGRWSTWRMDVSDGWVADEGVSLARLLR